MEGVALLVALGLAVGTATGVVARRSAPAPQLSLDRPRPLPSSPPTGQDAKDIRSFDAWTLHPGHEVSPKGVVAAFLQAERGYPQIQCDLIDDLIEGDCTLRNAFEQREQEVAGKPWVLTGEGSDQASATAAQVLSVAMKRLCTSDAFEHLLAGANRHGWGAVEIDWDVAEIEGKKWIVPVALTNVRSRRFLISPTDELRLFADISRPQGDELRPGKWLILKRKGPLARAGLMRTAAWPAIGKRLGWRDWLIFSQRFGLPLPLASYPDGNDTITDADAITVAEKIVKNIGSDGGAVKPKSIELEMLEATKTTVSNDKTHGGLIAHCNAEMSKIVCGSTLKNDNSGSGGASYALGEVHAKTSWRNVEYDASKLQEALRVQLFVPFMKFNGLAGEAPNITIQVEYDDTPDAVLTRAVRAKNQLGIEVSISQVRASSGLREPSGTDDQAPGLQVKDFPAAGGGLPS